MIQLQVNFSNGGEYLGSIGYDGSKIVCTPGMESFAEKAAVVPARIREKHPGLPMYARPDADPVLFLKLLRHNYSNQYFTISEPFKPHERANQPPEKTPA